MARAGFPRPPAVARVLRKVTTAARRHRMFGPGARVLVAVSGGPDSVCLLHSLVRLQRLLQIEVAAFHFDHRLRDGSERDAAYVRGQCERLGVPFVLREARSKPRRGESVEAWARTVRYEALTDVLEELGGGVAAVGHTADDQAETVMMALIRGSGLEALTGMDPVSRPFVRPLLEVKRDETVAFCRSLGLRPRRDPMNEDPSFMRVAVRKQVIPYLERQLGRGVRQSLVRTAELLREDAALLESMTEAALAEVVELETNGRRLRVEALRELPPPIQARVVREAIVDMGGAPDAALIQAVRSLAEGRPGRRVDLPAGLSARREREYVRLIRPSPGSKP